MGIPTKVCFKRKNDPIKTLRIIYQIYERTPKAERGGEETWYIDLRRNRERVETVWRQTIDQVLTEKRLIRICDGQRTIHLPSQCSSVLYSHPKEIPVLDDVPTSAKITQEGSRSRRARPPERYLVGTEDIMEFPCEVFDTPQGQVWLWNEIALREETRRGAWIYSRGVLNIEIDVKLDSGLFRLPHGVKV